MHDIPLSNLLTDDDRDTPAFLDFLLYDDNTNCGSAAAHAIAGAKGAHSVIMIRETPDNVSHVATEEGEGGNGGVGRLKPSAGALEGIVPPMSGSAECRLVHFFLS